MTGRAVLVLLARMSNVEYRNQHESSCRRTSSRAIGLVVARENQRASSLCRLLSTTTFKRLHSICQGKRLLTLSVLRVKSCCVRCRTSPSPSYQQSSSCASSRKRCQKGKCMDELTPTASSCVAVTRNLFSCSQNAFMLLLSRSSCSRFMCTRRAQTK